MEQLIFDSGIREYSINGKGVLRFNPADPNLYARYIDATEKIDAVEKELGEKAAKIDKKDPKFSKKVILFMRDADTAVKAILSEVFGVGNDLDQIFENVNVMAMAENGKRVIENFMDLIGPIIISGVNGFVDKKVEEAKLNREQRRAMNK